MRSPFLPLMTFIACAGALAAQPGNKPDGAQIGKKPPFKIAKDTTYFTAPLDQDGYVDYVKAVNERLRQGVTPQNNAAVLYFKAIGPRTQGKRVSAEYFHWLQIPELQDGGDYFVELIPFMRKQYHGEGPRDIRELEDTLSVTICRFAYPGPGRR